MNNFSNDFPILNQYVYANTAAAGILSEKLMEWRQEKDLDYLIGGSMFYATYPSFLENIRKTVAGFFKAEKENTVLVPNFSFGFNTLINGLEANQKVLLIEGDYPSVNWPIKANGYSFSTVELDENLEKNIEKAFETNTPTLFAFSIVQYISGIKIDLNFIDKLKNKYPEVLFVADGTQYCGTENFNFSTSGIDILGASGYKWLLAGYGNGFFIFKDEVKKKIFEKSFEFDSHEEDFLKNKNHLTNHFEPGHHDMLNFGSLKFSIEYLTKIGIDKIESHLTELSVYAKQKFTDLGLLDDSTIKRKQHSTIFSLKANKSVLDLLKSKDIICSIRGGGLRISFHFYNSKKDVDKITSVLKNVK